MKIFLSFTFWNHYDCSTCIYTHGRLCKQWVDGQPNTTLPQLWQSLCHVSNTDGSLREPVELETRRDVTPAARGHAAARRHAAAAHQPDGGTGEAAWSSRCQSPRWPGGKCCRQQPPPAWLCVDRSASVWTRCLFCPVLLIWTLFKKTTTTNKIKQNKILCEFTDRCRYMLWKTHTAGSLFLLFCDTNNKSRISNDTHAPSFFRKRMNAAILLVERLTRDPCTGDPLEYFSHDVVFLLAKNPVVKLLIVWFLCRVVCSSLKAIQVCESWNVVKL